jgi:hypothetical protein
MLHGLMGMCTEAGEVIDALKRSIFYGKELDAVNVAEEVGDLCWYLAIICDVLDLDFDKEVEGAMEFNDTAEFRPLLLIATELNAVCGGNLVTFNTQGQPHIIKPLFYLMDEIIDELDADWGNICETNIAKLKARYGDKFDAHKAINRDTDKEREILEA